MQWVSRMWRRLFPEQEPDPRVVAALNRVDASAEELERTLTIAHTRGIFVPLQDSIRVATDEAQARIRRRSRGTRN